MTVDLLAEPQLRSVTAVFDGRFVRFELPREHHAMASLEAAIGSPLAALNRFRSGGWRVEDIRLVLAHAHPDAVPLHRLTRVDAVDAAFEVRPAAIYALLATRLLEAMLLGLDPAAARFDEDAPFDV